jgi:hypothetical protein
MGQNRAATVQNTVQKPTQFLPEVSKSFTVNDLMMVEAAGVEPASERASNREPSCFFQFIFVSSSTLRTDKDAATTSLISLVFAAQTEQGRPAYCATIGTGP